MNTTVLFNISVDEAYPDKRVDFDVEPPLDMFEEGKLAVT